MAKGKKADPMQPTQNSDKSEAVRRGDFYESPAPAHATHCMDLPAGKVYHAIPVGDADPHSIDGGNCSCRPVQDEHGVWIHNKVPGRATA